MEKKNLIQHIQEHNSNEIFGMLPTCVGQCYRMILDQKDQNLPL